MPERMKNVTIETTDPHALLDSLTNGDRIKAAWVHGEYTSTIEGQVIISGREVWCGRVLRWSTGEINKALASFEVTRTEEHSLPSFLLRSSDGRLCPALPPITVHHTIVHRWEREKEHPHGAMSAGTHTRGRTFDLSVEAAIHNHPNDESVTCTRCQLIKLMWGAES